MEIICGLLPYEFDAKVELAFASDGLCCRIKIPAGQLTSARALRVVANGTVQALH